VVAKEAAAADDDDVAQIFLGCGSSGRHGGAC
jgi:hypothetical protein